MDDSFLGAIDRLPPFLRGALAQLSPQLTDQITEVRLRAERPVQLVCSTKVCFLGLCGPVAQPAQALKLTGRQVAECFLALCAYSVHSYQNQLKNGYFTLPGGHRVGIAGQAVCDERDTIVQLEHITSLNIRIARRQLLTLDPLLEQAMQGCAGGMILAGEPQSGKTTVLRAMSGFFSSKGRQVAVVDQRRELWPDAQDGKAPPLCCDVLAGYPRAEGIIQALRSLSPDVILCDEVGSVDDARAIEAGANAGVQMVVSIHARSKEELLRRPQGRLLLATGAFEKVIFLEGKAWPGKVGEVCDCAFLEQACGQSLPVELRVACGQ